VKRRWDQDDRLAVEINDRRIQQCCDALLGIPNPAEFVRAARELAEAVETSTGELLPEACENDIRFVKNELSAALSAFRAAGGGQ
jgi:hypothetical protein